MYVDTYKLGYIYVHYIYINIDLYFIIINKNIKKFINCEVK